METTFDHLANVRAALVTAQQNSPEGKLSPGEKDAIVAQYFGLGIPLIDEAALGLIRLARPEGEIIPQPGFTSKFEPSA